MRIAHSNRLSINTIICSSVNIPNIRSEKAGLDQLYSLGIRSELPLAVRFPTYLRLKQLQHVCVNRILVTLQV